MRTEVIIHATRTQTQNVHDIAIELGEKAGRRIRELTCPARVTRIQ